MKRTKSAKRLTSLLLVLTLVMSFFFFSAVQAEVQDETYDVGPGCDYENIRDVPFNTLGPGDTVNIHWREEPYKERIEIMTSGTEEKPITIHGVPGPEGQLPVIDGDGAKAMYQNGNRWVVKVTGPADDETYSITSKNIVIENLEIKNGKPGFSYTKTSGTITTYNNNAAGLWIERGENITVRNVTVHNCGNGFFVTSYLDTEEHIWGDFVARNILVEGCYFYGNGNAGSMYEHNSYCAAIGITYQYNRYGPLASEAYGYGLKDRSSRTVVRYNYIEGGRRQISLDDGEDHPLIVEDPEYDVAFVYGNVLVENDDGPIRLWGDDEIISFGGDNADTPDRMGPLYFYNNTIVTYRPARTYTENSLDLERAYPWDWAQDWTTLGRVERTCWFYCSSGQIVDVRNNIFYAAAANPAPLAIGGGMADITLSNNWIGKGWVKSMEAGWVDGNLDPEAGLVITDDGTNITGKDPGFVDVASQDFRLHPGSPCVDRAGELDPAILGVGGITLQYKDHQSFTERRSTAKPEDKRLDIGAYELPSGRDLGEYMRTKNHDKK